MLREHNAGSQEGAAVSEGSTINGGLSPDYLHENLISLFSVANQSCSLAVFTTFHFVSLHGSSDFLCFNVDNEALIKSKDDVALKFS